MLRGISMTNEQMFVNASALSVSEKFTHIFKSVMNERRYKIDDLVSKRTVYRALDPEDTTTTFKTITKLCVALDITLTLSFFKKQNMHPLKRLLYRLIRISISSLIYIKKYQL